MNKQLGSIIFSFVLLIVFILMAIEATSFAKLAKFFPLYIAIGAIVITSISILLQLKGYRKDRVQEERASKEENLATFKYILWILGFVVAIYVLGFVIATVIFLIAFQLLESKHKVLPTLGSTAVVIGLLYGFTSLMNLYWPKGLLGLNIF